MRSKAGRTILANRRRKGRKKLSAWGGRNIRFLAFETLKKKNDFEKLRKEGKVFKSKYLILYILPNEGQKKIRAGFGVGKKKGKAFQRNKLKRRLKEVLKKVSKTFGIDLFIIARQPIFNIGYNELKEELEKYLNKIF